MVHLQFREDFHVFNIFFFVKTTIPSACDVAAGAKKSQKKMFLGKNDFLEIRQIYYKSLTS